MLKVDINLLFTVINLGVIFFVIWKFLFKPVKKIIAKRQEEVEGQYAKAEEAKALADEERTKYEQAMSQAEDEKNSIIKEGRAQAGSERDKIIADAKNEASGIVETAKKDAEEARKRIMLKGAEELSELVSQAAGKIAQTKEDPEADSRLFDDFISKTGV